MLSALLLIVLALGNWIVPQLPRLLGFGDEIASVGGVPGPEVPSTPAFTIWGVIFTGALLYAVRQALPSRRDAVVYQSIRGPALVAFAASCAWMATAQFYGNGRSLVALIVVYLMAAATALMRLLAQRGSLDSFDRFVTMPTFGLLTGWLAAATWLNISSLAKLEQWVTASPTIVAAGTLTAVGLTAIVLLRRTSGYLPFAAAVLWALGWVVHANVMVRPNRDVVMFTLGLALVLVAVVIWQRRPVRQTDRIYR
jgi:hypothetical protein